MRMVWCAGAARASSSRSPHSGWMTCTGVKSVSASARHNEDTPAWGGPKTAVTAGLIGVVVLLFFKRELMVRWVDACFAWLPSKIGKPFHRLFHAFLAGLEALTDKRQLSYLSAYSLWLWICFMVAFWCGA